MRLPDHGECAHLGAAIDKHQFARGRSVAHLEQAPNVGVAQKGFRLCAFRKFADDHAFGQSPSTVVG